MFLYILLLLAVVVFVKCISCRDKYINSNIDVVIKQLEVTNTRYRIVERDGVTFPTTKDYVKDRLNFHVENNIIVKYSFG